MAESSRGRVSEETPRNRAIQLAGAYEQLESFLETVDIENEPELAEGIIDALRATDRVHMLEREKRRSQFEWRAAESDEGVSLAQSEPSR